MFIRSFLLASIASVATFSCCDNLMVGDASHPDRASQRYIETLTDPVRQRFAAVTVASKCRQEDNRYAFDLLMSHLNGAGRAILERAASDGSAEGHSVALQGNAEAESSACEAAVDKLRAADDRLLLLAERFHG